jgi:hypothetical protein
VQLRSYRRPMSWPGMTQSVIGTLALTRRSARNPRSGCLTTKWRSGCQAFSIRCISSMEVGTAAAPAWCGYETARAESRRALSSMRFGVYGCRTGAAGLASGRREEVLTSEELGLAQGLPRVVEHSAVSYSSHHEGLAPRSACQNCSSVEVCRQLLPRALS